VRAIKGAGIEVLATREPGDAPGADEIRKLLLNGPPERWDAVSEALLMVAARHSHIEATVRPALDAGKWVVCDRFADSTTAYQGYGGGVELGLLAALHRLIAGEFEPDLTLILDVPVETGLARAGKRKGDENRFERKGKEFHERVREGFLEIARSARRRCVVIDATRPAGAVRGEIIAAVRARFGLAL